MGESQLPRINEVTAFLKQFAPDVLQGLEASKPEIRSSLETGLLGGADAAVDDAALRSGLAVRAEILATALSTAIERAHAATDRIGQRLKHARRLRFAAEVLATIGASSVIGTALLEQRLATLVAGFLALGSNLVALFATKVVLGGDQREPELMETARRLTKASASAELTQSLLHRIRETDFGVEEMRTILQESNMLFAEMSDALSAADL